MFDLRGLQLKELEIMQAVHDACEKLGIEYYICFGTLIGAVRHKGFIPWDDDIDIMMTYENFDRFINEAPAVLPPNLKIQHWKYEDCPNLIPKVRDVNTTFLHAEHVGLDINQGVFIDIFPLLIVKDMKHLKRELKKEELFSAVNRCLDQSFVDTVKRASSIRKAKILHAVFTKGPFKIRDRRKFIAREENRRRKLSSKGYDFTYLDNCWGPLSMWKERALYEFEGHQFWGPKDYDTVLKLHYGDYMTLPPPENQRTHKPLFVDLEKGYSKDEILDMVKSGKIEL